MEPLMDDNCGHGIDCRPDAPRLLGLDGHWLMVLDRDLDRVLPQEGCALLLGEILGPRRWGLRWIWPCLNSWTPPADRHRRFQVAPAELVAAQRWARDHRWQLLGSAHSHPTSGGEPSVFDLSMAWDGSLLLIRGHCPAGLGVWLVGAGGEPPQAVALGE
jgi:[CysO sulfur-carrier protein]-S-L-cysteine hydrolase